MGETQRKEKRIEGRMAEEEEEERREEEEEGEVIWEKYAVGEKDRGVETWVVSVCS